MGSGFQGIALAFAVVFISLFVALLWLVQRVFKARGWHEWGTSARPIQIRSRAVSRLVGAVIALVGCGFVLWSWSEAHSQRFFSYRMATLGPTLLGIGAWMLVEGPIMPPGRETYPPPSWLGWFLLAGGLGLGLLYSEFLRTGRLPFAL